MIWWWLLIPGLLAEIFFGLALWQWKSDLGRLQDQIDAKQRRCYACVTGSSVTSFSEYSASTFCQYHRAHWHLINDLEQKALGDADG